MKKTYVKVIFGFCFGRNITTPGNKGRDSGEDDEE